MVAGAPPRRTGGRAGGPGGRVGRGRRGVSNSSGSPSSCSGPYPWPRSGRPVRWSDRAGGSSSSTPWSRPTGVEVAWSRALRIRADHRGPAVEPTVPEDDAPARPPTGGHRRRSRRAPRLPQRGRGHALRERGLRAPGPGHGVVPPAVPGGARRAPHAVGADGGGRRLRQRGGAPSSPFGSSLFINPDLTVSLHRPPIGGVGLPGRPHPLRDAGHRRRRVGAVGRGGPHRPVGPEPGGGGVPHDRRGCRGRPQHRRAPGGAGRGRPPRAALRGSAVDAGGRW